MSLGLSLAEVSDRLSGFPADFLGRHDLGRLVPGARADLVVLDPHLNLRAVHVAGRRVEGDSHVPDA